MNRKSGSSKASVDKLLKNIRRKTRLASQRHGHRQSGVRPGHASVAWHRSHPHSTQGGQTPIGVTGPYGCGRPSYLCECPEETERFC